MNRKKWIGFNFTLLAFCAILVAGYVNLRALKENTDLGRLFGGKTPAISPSEILNRKKIAGDYDTMARELEEQKRLADAALASKEKAPDSVVLLRQKRIQDFPDRAMKEIDFSLNKLFSEAREKCVGVLNGLRQDNRINRIFE